MPDASLARFKASMARFNFQMLSSRPVCRWSSEAIAQNLEEMVGHRGCAEEAEPTFLIMTCLVPTDATHPIPTRDRSTSRFLRLDAHNTSSPRSLATSQVRNNTGRLESEGSTDICHQFQFRCGEGAFCWPRSSWWPSQRHEVRLRDR